jgi:prepilin peptidase CpaA
MIINAVLFALLLLCVISDLKTAKIRNMYVLPVSLIGMIINSYRYGFSGLKFSVVGMTLPILVLGLFFGANLIGAGDIKLFGAIGALLGGSFVLYSMAYSFIFAGMIAFISLAISGQIKSTFSVFYHDLKTCFLTSDIMYLQYCGTKNIIKLSPAIAMGVSLQMLLCSF